MARTLTEREKVFYENARVHGKLFNVFAKHTNSLTSFEPLDKWHWLVAKKTW